MKATDMHSGLTAERVREIFSYDPDTGILTWKDPSKFSNRKAGTAAGYKAHNGYMQLKVDYRLYLAHRLVWLYVHGEWPVNDIDHINGVRDDNRVANLRDVSRQVNLQNQRKASHGPIRNPSNTGLLGTYFNKRRRSFIAHISNPITGKYEYLGGYATAEEAHDAYIKAKRRLHAGNTL